MHRDSQLSPFFPGNIASTERLKQAVGRSQERIGTLHRSIVPKSAGQFAHKTKQMEAPISRGRGEFFMTVGIGEPYLPYVGIVYT